MDAKEFEKKLKGNGFNGVGGARKSLGRLGLDDKTKAKYDAMIVKHFEGPGEEAGDAAVDPKPAKPADKPTAKAAADKPTAEKTSKVSQQLPLPFSGQVQAIPSAVRYSLDHSFHTYAATSAAGIIDTLTQAKSRHADIDLSVIDHVLMPLLEEASSKMADAYRAVCADFEEAKPVPEAKTTLGRLQSGVRKAPTPVEEPEEDEAE